MLDHPAVEETPEIGDGYPQVWGTRTPVRCLVEVFRATRDVGQTAAMFPHLSREQVQLALDYYMAYPARVDEDIERNARAFAERQVCRWPA
jgi:uncharacterized protein (DUF433 family)